MVSAGSDDGFVLTFAENKFHSRLCTLIDLLENKRPRLWPICQYTAELLISVSFLAASKQSSALAMHPFEFKVTSERHKC